MINVAIVMETKTLEAQIPLLHNSDVVNGYTDYKGYAPNRSKAGGWKSAAFILGQEISLLFLLSTFLLADQKLEILIELASFTFMCWKS